MANVFGVHPTHAAKGIEPLGSTQAGKASAPSGGVSDTVEISIAGKLAAKINDASVIRTDLVDRVKGEIAAGTYETPERVDATVDRLMDELFPELR
jgi:negative regulator of flagellin synthesis FlgM